MKVHILPAHIRLDMFSTKSSAYTFVTADPIIQQTF